LLSPFRIAGYAVLAFVALSGAPRYRPVSQHGQIDEVRRNLAAHAARVNAAIQSGVCFDFRELDIVLERMRNENPKRIVWMQMRDESGAVRAHAGMRAAATFPLEFARSQLRKRRPVFGVTQTEAGPVLLEVFPVRLPHGSRHASILTVANEAEQFGVIEIAARLDGGVATPGARRDFPLRVRSREAAGLFRMSFL
jgi:hypothetical protein